MTKAKTTWQQNQINEIKLYLAHKKTDQVADMLNPLILLLNYFDEQVTAVRSTQERLWGRQEKIDSDIREIKDLLVGHTNDIARLDSVNERQ